MCASTGSALRWAVREQGVGVPLDPTKSRSSSGSGSGSEDFQKNIRTRRMPRSGGLVEAEFQGLSGMDAARAAMGQGWPFAACP
ncbi:hypothetical protein FEA48_24140 [Pseudomonas nitroreducens]|uniref:Uncharacterized protein n=1 Tax=Pseudomonas nitroreducens TaxID=46680 RepID=A0A5R8ZYJ6_PSENT|nr:hypothetical protein FEA48_24140 [Pseudomonas nitroreducens]